MVGPTITSTRRHIRAPMEVNSASEGTDLAQQRLTIAAGVSFGTINGRNVLFSEPDQALFEINDTAAYIWRSLEERIGLEVIVKEMADQGLSAEVAASHLRSIVLDWICLNFINPAVEFGQQSPVAAPLLCQNIRIAGISARIRYVHALASCVAPVFEHLEAEEIEPKTIFDVVDFAGQLGLFRNGRWILSCSAEELATNLKGQVLDEVLAEDDYDLALHAATLVRNDHALLITGHSGAGKTTLTMALTDAGFGFAGDDLALLNSDGRVIGVPFAPAVKAGSWKLIAAYRPDIYDLPVFRRPDRKRVRYPSPHCMASTVARTARWIVHLDRRAGSIAELGPVDPVYTLRELLQEAHTKDRRLTTSGFRAVKHVVDQAECYRLTYSRLEDAVELLRQSCQC